MHVRIDETGKYCVVAKIDHAGTRAFQTEDGLTTTRGHDAAVPHGDSLNDSVPRVHCVDAPGEENRIGKALTRLPRASRTGSGNRGCEEATADPAQDVTATLQASHDMHETFVAGIAH
ncbi:hypothetical protein [Brevundimonas sp. AJA228-03]|uniref:hypothetical protein n=1 Tax=Brevundimonas sp. AJA228-03 TaxID=2752515 RepID=UPI001FD7F782|nr:hypothetical protein [Brevundimonas sp. AJA228-03]